MASTHIQRWASTFLELTLSAYNYDIVSSEQVDRMPMLMFSVNSLLLTAQAMCHFQKKYQYLTNITDMNLVSIMVVYFGVTGLLFLP